MPSYGAVSVAWLRLRCAVCSASWALAAAACCEVIVLGRWMVWLLRLSRAVTTAALAESIVFWLPTWSAACLFWSVVSFDWSLLTADCDWLTACCAEFSAWLSELRVVWAVVRLDWSWVQFGPGVGVPQFASLYALWAFLRLSLSLSTAC